MRNRIFYTSSGKSLLEEEMRKLPCIGAGIYGMVFKYEEGKVIKITDISYDPKVNRTIETIKNLKLPGFYKIYEILSDSKFADSYNGNIASYHESEDIDIWEMPSDWLIENYENLYESIVKLGENCILAHDLHDGNCIVNSKGITIIDVDRYFKYFKCDRGNLNLLYEDFLLPLLRKNLVSKHPEIDSGYFLTCAMRNLFGFLKEDEKRAVKILSKYPKPIDYLRDRLDK